MNIIDVLQRMAYDTKIKLLNKQDRDTAVTHGPNTSVGSEKRPIYVNSSGVSLPIDYKIEKSVPSDAVFTDTNTWRGIQNNLESTSEVDSLSAAQGKILSDRIGDMSTIATTEKGSIVGAINEVNSNLVNEIIGYVNIPKGESKQITFSSYTTSAIVFGVINDTTGGILYLYSNGYILPILSNSNVHVSLSKDYKTITIENTYAYEANFRIGIVNTRYGVSYEIN